MSRTKGELLADIKLLAGDVKEVVFTVPDGEPTLYMFSRSFESQGMAETVTVLR
ncbi:MAG: hypothetical protein OXD46_09305 [Chloroflexi bacterium]|nr:hypothetical protein [Chloroflexota bacterium]